MELNDQKHAETSVHVEEEVELEPAKGAGAKVIIMEEPHTSKASFMDNDPLPAYRKDKRAFSDKRIARGLH